MSGLPKRWDLPYTQEGNWPFTLQVSWLVFTKDGQLVKTEDHYIKDLSIDISESSRRIHGLTQEFININGQSRKDVLSLLRDDLQTYQPIVIGHFIELDFHVLSADYQRLGQENPMQEWPFFCTMLATRHRVKNPAKKYLSLDELHQQLFAVPFANQHNALDDAAATAACFFELLKRREIQPGTDYRKQIVPSQKGRSGCSLSVLALLTFFITLFLCFWL